MRTRREFVGAVAAGAGFWAMGGTARGAEGAARPNILWIVSEDNNPFLGCYGEKLARTPTLDRLAAEGVLYENCFSAAPVCAPSRFTLITGMYATSCGPAQHMRAQGKMPAGVRGFPAYLREAGYYCTNNAKTDYNAPIDIKDAWDECGKQAHWRKRPAGRPFFAVFNHEITHESSNFPAKNDNQPPLEKTTDPAAVTLPPYHPDTPEFRRDWAHYFDQMARLDAQVARLLKQLEEDGLLEETIIFYYGDNGGILPRSKRFCYDSGLHVPLIVRFPKKYPHLASGAAGSRIGAPVSFVDFAPTVLSLAGAKAPGYFEGQAFAGAKKAGGREYAFSFRNRMDERYDMVRTARDSRYRYIRNYMPHLPNGQHVAFMFQQRSVATWHEMYKAGKLAGPQKRFWEARPFEELYDLKNDPHEVTNLAGSAEHEAVLKRMRAALDEHMLRTRDNGFVPESSALEGYVAARDAKAYPLERIMGVAGTVALREPGNLPKIVEWLGDENECVRYWAALGCVMLRETAAGAAEALEKRLKDASGPVRVAAAEALCHVGQVEKGLAVLKESLEKEESAWVRLQAINSLQYIGEKARPALAAMQKAREDENNYVIRAAEWAVAQLTGEEVKGEPAQPKGRGKKKK